MKINLDKTKKLRIEMLPLIDIVFLLLVFFIYAMLSMAVHRGLPVKLPSSSSAEIDKRQVVSVTIRKDGIIYVDKKQVGLEDLSRYLKARAGDTGEQGVMLFADRGLTYQKLFRVLDQIRTAGISRISLQAEADE